MVPNAVERHRDEGRGMSSCQSKSDSAVHFQTGNANGNWALCIDGWNSSRNIRKSRALTSDRAAVTCKTCLKMLARRAAS